jgi:hypothetical protein
MSVFLRWGIFGILAVAALLYAYNASKRMATRQAEQAPPVAEPAAAPDEEENVPEPPAEPRSVVAAHCEVELIVARRALLARRQNEPVDRVLRMQEIAWQEPLARRQRLEKVATAWYGLEGDEPGPEALRVAVISDCMRSSPAP